MTPDEECIQEYKPVKTKVSVDDVLCGVLEYTYETRAYLDHTIDTLQKHPVSSMPPSVQETYLRVGDWREFLCEGLESKLDNLEVIIKALQLLKSKESDE